MGRFAVGAKLGGFFVRVFAFVVLEFRDGLHRLVVDGPKGFKADFFGSLRAALRLAGAFLAFFSPSLLRRLPPRRSGHVTPCDSRFFGHWGARVNVLLGGSGGARGGRVKPTILAKFGPHG